MAGKKKVATDYVYTDAAGNIVKANSPDRAFLLAAPGQEYEVPEVVAVEEAEDVEADDVAGGAEPQSKAQSAPAANKAVEPKAASNK